MIRKKQIREAILGMLLSIPFDGAGGDDDDGDDDVAITD